jgi:hypothetical protein
MKGLAAAGDGRGAAAAGNHRAAQAIGSGVDEASGAFHHGAAVEVRPRLGALAASPPREPVQKALLARIIWTELSIQSCASVVGMSKGPKGQTPKVQIRNDRSP